MRPPIRYTGSLMSDAAKSGAPRKFFPIPRLSASCYAFQQDYQQARASFVATALNTASPDDATAFLQVESPLQDLGGDVVQWTRSYYQIPPSWDDWENISYTFPIYPGYLALPSGVTQPVGRGSITPVNGVTCRAHYDYFMVGPGQAYANEGAIPEIAVQTYVGAANPTFHNDPPMVVPAAGVTVGTNTYLASVPSRETWNTWVTNAANLRWASGTVNPAQANPGQIVVSCKLQQLAGNIWARVTRYVLAQ